MRVILSSEVSSDPTDFSRGHINSLKFRDRGSKTLLEKHEINIHCNLLIEKEFGIKNGQKWVLENRSFMFALIFVFFFLVVS